MRACKRGGRHLPGRGGAGTEGARWPNNVRGQTEVAKFQADEKLSRLNDEAEPDYHTASDDSDNEQDQPNGALEDYAVPVTYDVQATSETGQEWWEY